MRREKGADEADFVLAVGRAVGMEDVVMPDGGLAADIGFFPGIPGKPGLRLAGDEAPVDGCDFVFLGDGQDRLKRAAAASGHVFGAEDRAMELLEPEHALLELLGFVVIVKGNHIGQFKLELFHGAELLGRGPIALPNAAGERLRGARGTRPGECFR